MKAPDAALGAFMAECHERLEHSFDTWLPAAATHPATLHEAMRYTVMDGGKRIRPTLVYAGGQAAGATPQFLDRAACAIELIHAYSLIHDDLPCMDDDDLRRGTPTCHVKFGSANAILTGDALLVPDTSLSSDQGGRYLLVVNGENVVEQRYITVGAKQEDGTVVVMDGLDGSEKYIINGMLRARPGFPVTPIESATTAPDQGAAS